MSKTRAWGEYEKGVDYKARIGLYNTVDINERFYSGDQWVGIPHEGLPTPVVNFIKYASAWKIAAVTDRRLGLEFFAEGISDGGEIDTYARQISKYCDILWERLKMDYLTKEGLKQAAITGDYVQYFYWDPDIQTGQALTGDISTMLVDNVNYYPGNPNSPDVQSQPYIILAFRELVSKVRDEAKRNGCRQVEEIVSDEENTYASGDMGKIEIEDSGKCNVLLKMYKNDGRVFCEKSVRDVVIQREKDTNLTRYPVALMNWETKKNCCHGTAEVTGLIPNQVFVNKILALSQLGQVQTSFPKVIFDKTRIKEWTNKVAGAIPVNGDIGGAAQYMNPPSMAYDAWRGLDVTLQTTMRMMGANDVTLGNVQNPRNTSAFIAARDAAMVPLQAQQERFYAFVEDVGHIWMDFIKNFYKAGRMIPVTEDGQRVFVPLPDDVLDQYTMSLRVDVGPSSMWSEIQVVQSLDNLLAGGKISFRQYLERMPEGHVPMKEELLAETVETEQAQGASLGGVMPGGQQMAGQMPPEVMQQMAAQSGMQAPMPAQPQQGAAPKQGVSDIAQIGGGAAILELVAAGVKSGDMPQDIAEAVAALAQEGADASVITTALDNAAKKGLVSEKFMAAVSQMTADAQQQGEQQQGGAGIPQGRDSAAILELVAAGVKSGDVPQDIAEAVAALAEEGADASVILTALDNAAKKGLVSEKFMAAVAEALKG